MSVCDLFHIWVEGDPGSLPDLGTCCSVPCLKTFIQIQSLPINPLGEDVPHSMPLPGFMHTMPHTHTLPGLVPGGGGLSLLRQPACLPACLGLRMERGTDIASATHLTNCTHHHTCHTHTPTTHTTCHHHTHTHHTFYLPPAYLPAMPC